MKIILKEYDKNWPDIFEKEKELILERLKGLNIVIEHIGSTSVPSLKAKPIIDILIGIDESDNLDDFIKPIISLNFSYIDKYNEIMPFRRFFHKDNNNLRTHNLHLVHKNHPFFKEHILFRNHLRNNLDDKKKYEDLKTNLSKEDWEHTNDYAEAKSDFITEVLNKIRNN